MPDPENNNKDEQNKEDLQAGGAAVSDVPELSADLEVSDTDTDTEESSNTPPDLAPEKTEPQESDDTTPFDDENTDRAIDEIVAKEGDEALAAQDAAAAKSRVKVERKRRGFSRLWHSKWLRYGLLFVLLAGIAAAAAVPKSRYFVLNAAGVRSTSSVVALDRTTQLPLKGVHVTIAGQTVDTDSEGRAEFSGLRLGPTELVISRLGFEEIKHDIVIGWGSNPMGNFLLSATGVQYLIEVSDYLSEKPIEGVEATDGEATAISDKEGKITLTLENPAVGEDSITLSKAGYRDQKVTLGDDPEKPTKAAMVLARKAVFATRQSGKYDLYKSDLDGQNRELLLAGTGHENSNISLAVSPDGQKAAFVSTRDNKRDSDGFLLSSLLLIDIEDGAKVTIAESAQVQLIDWVGSTLVFQLGASAGEEGDRYTLVSYDYSKNVRMQLASASRFNAVMSVRGVIHYAVAADPANPSLQTGLFRIGADGKDKQRVFEGELTTVLRSNYNTLSLQTDDGTWYTYNTSNGSKIQVGTPTSLANRLYTDNPDRSKSLWISQGSLQLYDVSADKESAVHTESGLAYPVQWLNATQAVFRISSGSETADYAISVEGGTPHKTADVAATYGFAQAQ
jgi:hypothetical protein